MTTLCQIPHAWLISGPPIAIASSQSDEYRDRKLNEIPASKNQLHRRLGWGSSCNSKLGDLASAAPSTRTSQDLFPTPMQSRRYSTLNGGEPCRGTMPDGRREGACQIAGCGRQDRWCGRNNFKIFGTIGCWLRLRCQICSSAWMSRILCQAPGRKVGPDPLAAWPKRG